MLLAQTSQTTISLTDAGAFANITGYSLVQIILTSVNLLFGIASISAFVFLLWGAVQWILAGGDKEGLEKAKKKITGAMVGLILVFSVYAFGQIINILFAVNIFDVCIPGINRRCSAQSPNQGNQVICSANCKSNPDGSEFHCYNEEIPGNPGQFRKVFCGPGGFRTEPV